MGPSAFTDGDSLGALVFLFLGNLASMGPSAFTDGDAGSSMISPGLIFLLQWGRRRSPTETGCACESLACLESLLQWGRRRSPTETARANCANISASYGLPFERSGSHSDPRIHRRSGANVRLEYLRRISDRAATRRYGAPDRSRRRPTVGYAVVNDHTGPQITTTVRSGGKYRRPMASTQLAARPSTGPRSMIRI